MRWPSASSVSSTTPAVWGTATGTGVLSAAGFARRLVPRRRISQLAAAFAGGPLGSGRLASVGPSGFQVGLVAVLEVGVTAALTAAATNWIILRRATRRRTAPADYAAPLPDAWAPAGVVDETDDVGGHRIYLNPWAAEEQDDQDGELPLGLAGEAGEYRDEP